MEVRYPIVILIVAVVAVLFVVLTKKKKTKYKKGSKIANTSYIKNTDYYKRKIIIYKICRRVLEVVCIVAILASTLMLARIASIKVSNSDEYNRDIMLCMDMSRSVLELNDELAKSLKETVKSLDGERFGISIFNTVSNVLVPLTDDYDYVVESLDKIQKGIDAYLAKKTDDESQYYIDYISAGLTSSSEKYGGSLIGDGLASCTYDFSKMDTKRTRIILFSTDNDLDGTPVVTLDEAASIAKKKDIMVYGIYEGDWASVEANKTGLKKASEKTGGKFYEHSKTMVSDIVADIEKTSKTLLENKSETKEIDMPQVPFIILVVSVVILVLLERKVVAK